MFTKYVEGKYRVQKCYMVHGVRDVWAIVENGSYKQCFDYVVDMLRDGDVPRYKVEKLLYNRWHEIELFS